MVSNKSPVSGPLPASRSWLSPRAGDACPRMVESRCGAVAVGRGYPLSAPFVWRCLNSQPITPFPHPAHRTGQAQLTHPALGQDILPSHTEGRDDAVQPTARTVASSGLWSRPALKTDDDTPAGNTASPLPYPGPPFASACGTFRSPCALPEFNRVAPISCALPLPIPALN